jgi:hypothetical protein
MAKFHEAIGAARRAREHHEAMTSGLPRSSANAPSPEGFAEAMGGLRHQLRKRGSRKHWHAGPDSCPVCGGRDADWHKKAVKRDRTHDPRQCLICRAKESA